MSAVLALLSSLFWGSADFAGGLAARRLPAVAVVAWSQAAGLVALTAYAVLTGTWTTAWTTAWTTTWTTAWTSTWTSPGSNASWLAWAVLAGIAGAGALICFYAALASGTMGVVSPIASLGALVPVIAGLLAGEQPSGLQWAGMIVALLGALGASGPELSGAVGRRSVVLAVIAGVGFGVALLGLARGAAFAPEMTAVVMRATSVIGFAALGLVRRTAGGVRPRDLPLLTAVGLADGGANLLYAIASRGELLTLVAVLGALYPVATVLLARFVLHERMLGVQAVGVLGALGGVALIAAG